MVRPPRIDQLLFKGTHNSYDAIHVVAPERQVDDFGVWALELDFSVLQGVAFIGHDGLGQGPDGDAVFEYAGSYRLRDYLMALHSTEAFSYRPLMTFFDYHGRSDVDNNWGEDLPLVDVAEILGAELTAVFPGQVFGPQRLQQAGGVLPPARDLAGWVLAWGPGGTPNHPLVFGDTTSPFAATYVEGCGAPRDGSGNPLPFRTLAGPQASRVWRLDNFTDEWTFRFGAPPNPIVVESASPDQTLVPPCDPDANPLSIGREGTRLFPFSTLVDAVDAARQPLRYSDGQTFTDLLIGAGFTILAAPGTYGDPFLVDFPLSIRARAS